MALSGLRWRLASSLALNSSNKRSCALFSATTGGATSVAIGAGRGGGGVTVAQAPSAASDTETTSRRAKIDIRGIPSGEIECVSALMQKERRGNAATLLR